MKVLFVASGNKNASSSKPSTVVNNQANSLIENGVEISFFLIEGKGILSYIGSIFPLYRIIRKNDFKVIHSHYSLSAFVTTFTIFLLGNNKVPHIVSLMGSDTMQAWFYKRLVWIFSKRCWTATIVKSPSMARELSLKRTYVIPNGVDLDSIKYIPKRRRTGGDKIVLFAADSSRKSKNFILAEKACSLINGIALSLRVVFNVSPELIISELNNTDILLSTSIWEGSPNIIKEAMACNCPVVATNVGDITWLFGDEPGYFLTSFNPEDVAQKIQMALKFSEDVGKTKGRERVIGLGLDSKTIAQRIIWLYNKSLLERSVEE